MRIPQAPGLASESGHVRDCLLALLCYVESNTIRLNLVPQQLQKPVALTSQGWIRRRTCSHVAPEVFLGADVASQDKKIGQRGQHQVMMKPAPRASFEMVQAQVIFGSLKILFHLPAGTAQLQAVRSA